MIEIGGLRVVKMPMILVGTALGSCIGLAIYDELHHIGGLAHIMLPYASRHKVNGMPAKFADRAIPYMLFEIEKLGGQPRLCRAKLAGGAKMFVTNKNPLCHIGERNIRAVIARLADYSIPIAGRDTGGDYARTVEFDTSNFGLSVKSFSRGTRKI